MKWKDIKIGMSIWYYEVGTDPISRIVSGVLPEKEPDDDGEFWMEVLFTDGYTEWVPVEANMSEIGCFVAESQGDLQEAILEFLTSCMFGHQAEIIRIKEEINRVLGNG